MEIILVRHAQASFGAEDYDRLSPLGYDQAVALGEAFEARGDRPDTAFVGQQLRHRQTFEGIAEGLGMGGRTPIVHSGLNEFDFDGLLLAHRNGVPLPDEARSDRQAFFRTFRKTVRDWQTGDIANPPEPWTDFSERTAAALDALRESGAERVIAVTSGGPIACIVSQVLNVPTAAMIELQLQMKNCAVCRLIVGKKAVFLHSFNELLFVNSSQSMHMVTYS